MSTFLVTGATGFVGRHLCALLSERGHRIRATRRTAQPDAGYPAGIEWIDGIEIGPETEWSASLADVDIVLHLAALAHQTGTRGEGRLDEFMCVNAYGTRRLAEAIASSPSVSRLVFVSSVGAVRSISREPITSETPCEPDSDYGRSKRAAEIAIEETLRQTRADWCIVRAPLVYGPGNPGNMARLLKLVRKGIPLPFASIRNARSLVFVGNLVDGIERCATSPAASRLIFLISDGEPLSTPELVRCLARHAGKSARLFPAPVALLKVLGLVGDLVSRSTGKEIGIDTYSVERLTGSLAVDSDALRSAIGWRPPFTQDEGLARTLI